MWEPLHADQYGSIHRFPITDEPDPVLFTSTPRPVLDLPAPTPGLSQPGNKQLFVLKSNGLKTLHVSARSLLFFTGVKETL